MILKALADYYNVLAEQGKIARLGWGAAGISYALVIDENGALTGVMSCMHNEVRGKKTERKPTLYQLPRAVTRSSGPKANFLWDHSGYLLGIDAKGNEKRSIECFEKCKELHLRLLSNLHSPAAKSVCAFFEHWSPQAAREHPALRDNLDDIIAGGNLIFRFAGAFVHDDKEIQAAWDAAFATPLEEEKAGRCLVTGKKEPIAPLHAAIKGVRGAQSSGAMLVSFNTKAALSYEKEQSLGASVGKTAEFAYTSALNHLLSDREHTELIGGTTVVFWAENAQKESQDFFCAALGGTREFDEAELMRGMDALAKGRPYDWKGTTLTPDVNFYILGLAPNAARLSVRFFYRNTFGSFMENLQRHYKRLEMVKPSFEQRAFVSISGILFETVNKNTRDKAASPLLSGALYRAVLNDTEYPRALVYGILLRIRAEHEITWGRASAIKAYLLKRLERSPNQKMKEALTMTLNDSCTYQPYVLGRLFSVYEALQEAAIPGINATIKDKFFNSAAATPASIFAILTRSASIYLRKLEGGQKIFYDKMITELTGKITETLPARHNLEDQEIFYIGYYHQKQKRFEKHNKED